MKIPIQPPGFWEVLSGSLVSGDTQLQHRMLNASLVDDQGRYLHWDKLRHLSPPVDMSLEQWWASIRYARAQAARELPLSDKNGQKFSYCIPDAVTRDLHWLDRHAAGSIQADEAVTSPATRDTYLIRSLAEEAINSSQLEGASTTSDVAREMIRQQRDPRDKSECMIANNYHAMQFIRDIKGELLTPSIIFELHRILTQNTLDRPNMAGRFRKNSEDIHVVDNVSQAVLHTPPNADDLATRMQQLCDFANDNDAEPFVHPVIKAIVLHFMLAYDHPFYDGNGRTARALFYWYMAKQGYWLVEFISISGVIKEAPAQYGRAYLYTETDGGDLTYFLLHQLEVIHKAIDALHVYLDKKIQGLNAAEALLKQNQKLRGKLNFRQLSLLRHALKHPRFAYVVDEHRNSHGVSYDVARKDLLQMSDQLKLLEKTKVGKRYKFLVPDDLEMRITQG